MAQYTLKLSFDIRQVTQSLAYEFVVGNDNQHDKNTAYPMIEGGPLAGTFNFQEKDELYVEVIATAPDNEDMQAFAVTNCTFVSIPATMTEDLSLFDPMNACEIVPNWEAPEAYPATPKDMEEKSKRLSIMSAQPLIVNSVNGQWQISGYLSVQLPPNPHTPPGQNRYQLYFFDPEGSTGTGGGWGP